MKLLHANNIKLRDHAKITICNVKKPYWSKLKQYDEIIRKVDSSQTEQLLDRNTIKLNPPECFHSKKIRNELIEKLKQKQRKENEKISLAIKRN